MRGDGAKTNLDDEQGRDDEEIFHRGALRGRGIEAEKGIGYQSADDKGKVRNGLHKVGFALVVALTVYVIIDIEYPRLGWIRIDAVDQVLINVRASMK